MTKKTQSKFDFDLAFPKMLSYSAGLRSSSAWKWPCMTRLGQERDQFMLSGRPNHCRNYAMPVFLPGCDVPRRSRKEKMKHIETVRRARLKQSPKYFKTYRYGIFAELERKEVIIGPFVCWKREKILPVFFVFPSTEEVHTDENTKEARSFAVWIIITIDAV